MPDVSVSVNQANVTANITSPNITATIAQSNVTANITAATVTANVTTATISVNIAAGLPGPQGDTGATGPQGATGQGVPSGGTAGQVLSKIDSTDYNTEWVDQSGGGANTMTITAGENLAALDLIYIAADGLAYKADATSEAKEAIAIIQSEILTGADGTAYLGQCPVTGFIGLSVNGRYFLSPNTPGSITATIPSGAGQIVQQIGKAYSATALLFGPQDSILIA